MQITNYSYDKLLFLGFSLNQCLPEFLKPRNVEEIISLFKKKSITYTFGWFCIRTSFYHFF